MLESSVEWIPVDCGLPLRNDLLLVRVASDDNPALVTVAWFMDGEFASIHGNNRQLGGDVTHWARYPRVEVESMTPEERLLAVPARLAANYGVDEGEIRHSIVDVMGLGWTCELATNHVWYALRLVEATGVGFDDALNFMSFASNELPLRASQESASP